MSVGELDALNRYLDGIASGAAPAAGDLDPELVDVVGRIQRLGRQARPSRPFLARLDAELAPFRQPATPAQLSWPSRSAAAGWARERVPRSPTAHAGARTAGAWLARFAPHAAFAALVALALVGMWASGELRGPASSGEPPSVRSGVIEQRPDEAQFVTLQRIELARGTTYYESGHRVRLILIEEGSVTISTNLSGTGSAFEQGETLESRHDPALRITNSRSRPASVLMVTSYSRIWFKVGLVRAGDTALRTLISPSPVSPGRNFRCSLSQVELEPGETMAPWSTHGDAWMYVESGPLEIVIEGPESGPASLVSIESTAFMRIVPLAPGVSVSATNTGANDNVFYVLALEFDIADLTTS
jgi:hypothetical protein